MRLSKLCVYAKVQSGTEALRLSCLKTSARHVSKQEQGDCLILAQKVNKNLQIKGLIEFYLFQAKYCAIVFCLILFACYLAFFFLVKEMCPYSPLQICSRHLIISST